MPLKERVQPCEWMGVQLTKWDDPILHQLARPSLNSWLDSRNGGVVDAGVGRRLT
jgi:hypothetical protein